MLSISEPVRFTPPWRKEADAPVYLLRHGSVIDRAAIEAELAGQHGGGRVFAFELAEAFRSGVDSLLADDPERVRLTELSDAEAALGIGEQLPLAEEQLLKEAREALAQHWPPYQALLTRMARRREFAPILALRRFCIGWENVRTPFARGADQMVALDALGRLDPLEMLAAGNEAFALLYPSDLEGNSQPASPSDDRPLPTPSDVPSPADGSSTAGAGPKTRGSRSRRGSGAS